MKHLIAAAVLLGALFTCHASMQSDMSGEWSIAFATPSGPQELTMFVAQEGARLSGRLTSEFGEFPLRGTLTDDAFVITWSMPDAGKLLDITFTGTVKGDALSGTATLGTRGQGPLSGTRTGQ